MLTEKFNAFRLPFDKAAAKKPLEKMDGTRASMSSEPKREEVSIRDISARYP
mgnify:CR=1 FL=1